MEQAMFGFSARIVGAIARIATRRRPPSRPDPGFAADWLPPVLGPDDLWAGMLADRSAGWYLDRR
jgi:hypothetical protein